VLTALAVAALRTAGADVDDPAFTRGVHALRMCTVPSAAGLDVAPFDSRVWDTARAVRLLARCGQPLAAARGARWLASVRCSEPPPADWQTPRPGAPSLGGWSFGPSNINAPDCDTTALVVDALIAAGGHDDVVDDGVAWLLGMQNPDGGWAAFTWGQPEKPVGPLCTTPPALPRPGAARGWWRRTRAELGDPSTAELTGRVLSTLGAAGIDVADSRVARAVEFVERQQWNGAWWGRWAVAYTAATADVLAGLHAVGVDMRRPSARLAIDRLLSWQNPDGGWGELPDVYTHPDRAGEGPSCAFHTGEVVDALARVGEAPAEVDRGKRWLRTHMGPTGWSAGVPIGVIQPPWGFYTLDLTLQCAGAEGLVAEAVPAPVLAPPSPKWQFVHELVFEAPIDVVFATLTEVERWPRWWSGLVVRPVLHGDALGVGRVSEVRFTTPLGYAMDTRYTTIAARPPFTTSALVDGDFEGRGRFDLSEQDGVTTVVHTWEVDLTRPWLNAVARVGRRALLWNHGMIMRRFERAVAASLQVSHRRAS
jgi:hypothetical protein